MELILVVMSVYFRAFLGSTVCLLHCGCIAVSQTSSMIAEGGTVYYFAVISRAKVAFSYGEKILLKCPVAPFEKQYTFAKIAMPGTYFGGCFYREIPTFTTEYAFVSVDASHEFLLPTYSICENIDESKLTPIPFESLGCTPKDFHPSLDAQPSEMYPAMPLVREETMPNSAFQTSCAVAAAVAVDFPLSVIMTLTGSFWYIPATK